MMCSRSHSELMTHLGLGTSSPIRLHVLATNQFSDLSLTNVMGKTKGHWPEWDGGGGAREAESFKDTVTRQNGGVWGRRASRAEETARAKKGLQSGKQVDRVCGGHMEVAPSFPSGPLLPCCASQLPLLTSSLLSLLAFSSVSPVILEAPGGQGPCLVHLCVLSLHHHRGDLAQRWSQ